MKTSYTIKTAVEGTVSKYPIVSKTTGLEYKVTIKPYCGSTEGFNSGSVVSLRKKKKIFDKLLLQRQFDNHSGKIKVSSWREADYVTDYDYNMVEMTKYIVDLYERSILNELMSIENYNKNYEEMQHWDGEV